MFNPSRLTLARVRRGMTKKDLAAAIGVTLRTMTRYEANEMVPSGEVIDAMATALGFPAEFFSASTIEPPSVAGVNFRALTSMTASRRNAALGAAALAMELSDWIAARFATPEPNVPDLRDDDPETAAEALRAEWGLGELPIRHVIHLLEQHGVRVFSLAEQSRDLDAFSFWHGTRPCVFLNTVKTAERTRFDGSHELGHLVLHRRADGSGRESEREADAFASAFLMPRGSVLACGASRLTNVDEIIVLKKRWGVSAAALNVRLHRVGMISEWQYRENAKEIQRRGFRRSEPDGQAAETSQVLQKVFQSLRVDGMNRSDVARELHISTEDLDAFIFNLVMRRLPGGSTVPTPRPDGTTLRKL